MTMPPVTPDEVRAHLARRRAAAEEGGFTGPTVAGIAAATTPAVVLPRAVTPLVPPPPDPAGDREAILAGISASYFRLRRGLAAIAFAFPIILWLGGGPGHLQASLSAYYHYAAGGEIAGAGRMRDVFVGVLWAIGSFLGLYRGYSAAENRALNVAGVAAIAVSVWPMDWPPGVPATVHGTIHYAAATLFFLAIAYVAVFRSADTLVLLAEPERARFAVIYRVLGILMVSVPAAVVAVHRLLNDPGSRWLLAVEVAGTWVFATFWAVKSVEIARIEAGP